MLKSLLLGLAVLLTIPAASPADESTYALPLMSPDFPGAQVSQEYQLDISFAAVTGLALRVQGLYQEVIYVDVSQPYGSQTLPVFLELQCGQAGATEWIVTRRNQFPAGFGAFDFTGDLLDSGHEDWPLLEGGLLRLGLACGPTTIQSTPGSYAGAASSWGQVTSLYLIVSYDTALPTESSSWDSLKALFR